MKFELTTGQDRFDGDVTTYSWLRHTIEVHPILWMDLHADEDSCERDICAPMMLKRQTYQANIEVRTDY